MRKNDVLVVITASRKRDELEYKVDCSSSITNEEFEYYLGEIIKGICEWKPGVCEENIHSHKGTIKRKKIAIKPRSSRSQNSRSIDPNLRPQ